MASLEGEVWDNTREIAHKSYVCGYCGVRTGIKVGYRTGNNNNTIYLCGGCNQPTFFRNNKTQFPPPILGNDVEHLPREIDALYQEARSCTQAGAYTSCILTCRKILMHVAVEEGAKKNEGFFYYVNYLADNGHLPPRGRGWVDHIRTKGNEANHEIKLMSQDEAQELLSFTEMLLKFVYELPASITIPTTTE